MLHQKIKTKLSEAATTLRETGTSRLPQEILENELEATASRLSDPQKLSDFEFHYCLPAHCNIQPEYFYCRNGYNKIPCACGGCYSKYKKGSMIHWRQKHWRLECALKAALKEAQQFQKFQADVTNESLENQIEKSKDTIEAQRIAIAELQQELKAAKGKGREVQGFNTTAFQANGDVWIMDPSGHGRIFFKVNPEDKIILCRPVK